MDIYDVRLVALDRARSILGNPGRKPQMIAATLRLAAIIEKGLEHGWTDGLVDGSADLFNEVEGVRPIELGSVGGEGSPFRATDCGGSRPDEALAGERFGQNTTPVAGLDTATVAEGGEAVTASPREALSSLRTDWRPGQGAAVEGWYPEKSGISHSRGGLAIAVRPVGGRCVLSLNDDAFELEYALPPIVARHLSVVLEDAASRLLDPQNYAGPASSSGTSP